MAKHSLARLSPKVLPHGQGGFTMMEVLVTVVVIALGLLGNAAMMLNASKINQGGLLRTQAVASAQEIAERMEANPTAAIAGNYAAAASDTPIIAGVDCASALCTPENLALHDLAAWQNSLKTNLPGAGWVITFAPAAGGSLATYTITVNWTERRTTASYTSSGTAETFSYTTTKTIYQ